MHSIDVNLRGYSLELMVKKYLFINFLIWFNFIGVDVTAQQPFPPCAADQKLDKCFGSQIFPDGEYVGDLVNGLREGKGTLINGAIFRYDGEFKNGLFHGEGRYQYRNGIQFVGEFSEGKRQSGNGRYLRGQFVYPGNLRKQLLMPPPKTTSPSNDEKIKLLETKSQDSICPIRRYPEMPRRAIQEKISGTLEVEALVDEGEVKEVRVLSGPPIFELAVVESLMLTRCIKNANGRWVAKYDFKVDID